MEIINGSCLVFQNAFLELLCQIRIRACVWNFPCIFYFFFMVINVVVMCCLTFQEHHVRTGSGTVSVIVYGDQDKPALITYPDLALNREYCYRGFLYTLYPMSNM